MDISDLKTVTEQPGTEKSSEKYSGTESRLMSIEEMGKRLGLRKTSRYALLKENLFSTTQVLGKQWILRDSFEKWYLGQDRYHIDDRDNPDAMHSSGALSIKEIAALIGRSTKTVSRIIRENGFETISHKNTLLVPVDVFQRWIAGQDRYKVHDHPQDDFPVKTAEQVPSRNSSGARRHNPAYLTVHEAAVLAGVSPTTVFAWIRENKLPARRCGRETYITVDGFNHWMNQWRKE